MRLTHIAATLAMLACCTVQAQQRDAVPGTRGAMLYETHCITCHTEQMHWRAQRLAQDWPSLQAQVRRWQAEARLGWSEDDIEAVARHLNDTIYRFRTPGELARR